MIFRNKQQLAPLSAKARARSADAPVLAKPPKPIKPPERPKILEVRNFSLGFESRVDGKIKQILRKINLDVYAGEKLAIIGESGSGKTVLSTAISCLLNRDAIQTGSIKVDGLEVVNLSAYKIQKAKIRGQKVSYVFQNPLQTMNPYLKIGVQLVETLKSSKIFVTQASIKKKVLDTLSELNLQNVEQIFNSYPHQLSGGMIQRVVIACSLLLSPKLLILDEPTSALDAVVELQIIELLNKIVAKGTAIILISHDLKLVSSFADRIAVMYAGRIVEIGTNREINLYPQHPYTWGLLMSIPSYGKPLYSIPGRVPVDLSVIRGDAFAFRNFDYALDLDFESRPPMFRVSPTHYAATWLLCKESPAYTPPPEIQKLWTAYCTGIPLAEPEIQVTPLREPAATATKALSIKDMEITYTNAKVINKVVHGVDLHINQKEIVGLIGESGSGKSTIAKAVAGLQDFSAAETKIMGVESPRFAAQIVGKVRSRFARMVQMIYQNPRSSLNSFKPVWKIVGEPLFHHEELLNENIRALYAREFESQQAINSTPIYAQILKVNSLNNRLNILKQELLSNRNLTNSQIAQNRRVQLNNFNLENSIRYNLNST